jgi:hypothetical protein
MENGSPQSGKPEVCEEAMLQKQNIGLSETEHLVWLEVNESDAMPRK